MRKISSISPNFNVGSILSRGRGVCCDNHFDRPATIAVITDMVRDVADVADFCQECYMEFRSSLDPDDPVQPCEICKADSVDVRGISVIGENGHRTHYDACPLCRENIRTDILYGDPDPVDDEEIRDDDEDIDSVYIAEMD